MKASHQVTTHSLPYYSSDSSRTFFYEDQPPGDHTLTTILFWQQQDIFPWRPGAKWPHCTLTIGTIVLNAEGNFFHEDQPSGDNTLTTVLKFWQQQDTFAWRPAARWPHTDYSSDSSRTFLREDQAPSDHTAHSLGTIVLTEAGHFSTKTSHHYSSDSKTTFLSEGRSPNDHTGHSLITIVLTAVGHIPWMPAFRWPYSQLPYYSSDCGRTFFKCDTRSLKNLSASRIFVYLNEIFPSRWTKHSWCVRTVARNHCVDRQVITLTML
jgi:hypothetical protein